MATAPLDIGADNQDGEQDNAPRDFEADAKRMGWAPKDSFKGDPEKHIDAETFVKRGEEMLPILQATNRDLLKKMATMERDIKRASEFMSKGEERAYQRALDDIRAQQEKAVEDGDQAALKAANETLAKLEKPNATPRADNAPPISAEEFAEWTADNPWYAKDDAMRLYADSLHEAAVKKNGGALLDLNGLQEIADKTAKRFKYGEEARGPEIKPRSAVDRGNVDRGARGGKTFSDLPPEAQKMADKWIKSGLITDRAAYVSAYDFS